MEVPELIEQEVSPGVVGLVADDDAVGVAGDDGGAIQWWLLVVVGVGWCPYQWTHSAVASSAASMSCQGPWPKEELGLVQRVERLGQGEAERESALESTEATASRSDRACP